MSPATAFERPPWHWPTAVYQQLITPPTEEPLTLAEAIQRAGFTWAPGDPREALMTGFIAAARSKVEKDTGLALLTQTWDIELEVAWNGLLPLPWQVTPIQTLTIEAAPPDGGTRVTLSPHEFRIDRRRRVIGLASWPATWGAYVLHVTSGWPSPAALSQEAPLLTHAVGLLTAHFATLGRDLASPDDVTAVPYGYEDAIAPHRLMWVP
jgi:uncharacterized phiE125 gp8 family phage protein